MALGPCEQSTQCLNILSVYDEVQVLCFWTLSIVLSLPKNTVLFIFQNTTFRRPSRFYLKTETESSLGNVMF
jgi:hypothetical protein